MRCNSLAAFEFERSLTASASTDGMCNHHTFMLLLPLAEWRTWPQQVDSSPYLLWRDQKFGRGFSQTPVRLSVG
jgi:hypothetical protein